MEHDQLLFSGKENNTCTDTKSNSFGTLKVHWKI